MSHDPRPSPRWKLSALVVVLGLCLAGCSSKKSEPIHENAQHGFSFCPPAGWSERAPLATGGARPAPERSLVRYKRLQAANPAWLSVTVAEVPPSVSLPSWLSKRPAGPGWQRQGEVQRLEVNGLAAARAAYRGRRGKRQLVGEVTAVAPHGRVYVFSAFFLPGDATARDEVRRSVASAAWPEAADVVAGR
ncbi:MAG TPA: hypothetical protein VG013_38375 [Gemmataceae bacterium]|jgi:hypothetical protein|nr:hypothetical protein [Gemmataceae bacterium]